MKSSSSDMVAVVCMKEAEDVRLNLLVRRRYCW